MRATWAGILQPVLGLVARALSRLVLPSNVCLPPLPVFVGVQFWCIYSMPWPITLVLLKEVGPLNIARE